LIFVRYFLCRESEIASSLIGSHPGERPGAMDTPYTKALATNKFEDVILHRALEDI